jgi:hypothetical protein
MFSKLTSMLSNTVKDQLEDKLMETIGFDSDKADDVVKVGTETIFDGFKDELLSGNISGLTNLVKGGAENMAENVMIKSITGKVVGALSEKVGLSPQISSQVVGIILPFIMDLLNKKDDDDSSFNIGGMFDMLTGAKSESDSGDLISGLAKGLGGLFG